MEEEELRRALEQTEVLRPPKGKLATFGSSTIAYYLLSQPIYAELPSTGEETVVREGKVIAERPRIVTPFYLTNLFEGFEHGQEYAKYVMEKYSPHEPGLLYRYKNELQGMNIVSTPLTSLAGQLNDRLDREGDPLVTIIKGVDELWDISLLKFVHDLTRSSATSNVLELESLGLLEMEKGVPREARLRIERLFELVRRGELEPRELKLELDRWGVFEEYQDRFLNLFRRR